MKRAKYSVDQMTEGEILVRGTRDPLEAIRIMFEIGADVAMDMLHGIPLPGEAGEPDPVMVAEFGDRLHGMLKRSWPDYYRKVHALPNSYGASEGWGWTLWPSGPGRGAFEGVEFP